MSISVLIADDHRIVRDGLRALIDSQPNMQIVAESADGWETIECVKQFSPDVVVMDISMPKLNGIEATRRIVQLEKGSHVLALSGHKTQDNIKDMLLAGAIGYLLKECAGDELITAILTVATGRVYVSPSVTNTVITDYVAHLNGSKVPNAEVLSGREREVLQLIAEGISTAAIADHLSLSVKTVESHRQRIMSKVDIRTVAGLTKYAIRAGITSLDD